MFGQGSNIVSMLYYKRCTCGALLYRHFVFSCSSFGQEKKSKVKLSRYMPWRHMGGERRYSSYSYTTSALDGGEWSASRPGRTLPPVPIRYEAGWAPELVWMQGLEEKSSAPVGD
jgi:hypothetical protein